MNQGPGIGKSTTHLMGRLWRDGIRGYVGWIVLAVIFMLVAAAATSYTAYLMKPVVDDVFDQKNESRLWIIAFTVLATFLVKSIANYTQAMLMHFVGLRILSDMQNRLFSHLSRMDLAFFHNHATGTLISRFTTDIHQMKVAVSNGLTSLGKDLMSLVGLVYVMFLQDLELALITFFVFPIAVYPIVRIGKRMRKVTANTQQEIGLFLTILNQTFQGIRMIKAYGMERYEAGRIADNVETIRVLNMKAARIQTMARPIMEFLGGVAVFVVIIYGGLRVIEGATTTGTFFSFITALLMAYDPMKRLAGLNASIQTGLAGADRLYWLLDQEPTIRDKPHARDIERIRGEIAFEKVSFSYTSNKSALTDISLNVPAGKKVALVGPSGAGKSTILNLIPRFYDVDIGVIRIDGQDVRDVTTTSLFQNMALVSQEITLFDDTVAANIGYGRANATREQVETAARHAAAHDFIMELPGGYDTIVGEQGVKLSGGQRQRLAIARAMIKDAPILLLDEATSALDTESERHVQAALDTLMEGRTSLVIAHRLSTVTHADIIFVVDNGRIVEQGDHANLMALGGSYKTLYDMQFDDELGPVTKSEPVPVAAKI
ncbi:MAG: ABC transporter ATP-binding protein [Alphaproteobacteria bacterium]|nr:ABC transporter ATP-binding protein [Alphaproteobacteria bacterium]